MNWLHDMKDSEPTSSNEEREFLSLKAKLKTLKKQYEIAEANRNFLYWEIEETKAKLQEMSDKLHEAVPV